MTSATEKLRRLLDERGIEYAESQDRFRTRFRFNYCEACCDYLNEIEVMGACITASKSYLTPEQAIAATLGSGTCENADKYPSFRFTCSECGCLVYYEDIDGEPYMFVDECAEAPRFCPNCGARIIQGVDNAD